MTPKDLKKLTDAELEVLVTQLSRLQFGLAIRALDEKSRDRWYRCISVRAQQIIQEDHRTMLGVTREHVDVAVGEALAIAEKLKESCFRRRRPRRLTTKGRYGDSKAIREGWTTVTA